MTSTTNTIQNTAQLVTSFKTTTHPKELPLEQQQQQQSKSIQYISIQILHIRHHWDTA